MCAGTGSALPGWVTGFRDVRFTCSVPAYRVCPGGLAARLARGSQPGNGDAMADHRGDQEQQVRWRLLGPVQVRTEGGWTGVGAGKLRGLLAVLLTEPGRVVSTERLIGELWAGTDPPAGW
jgi:hypothetical protein